MFWSGEDYKIAPNCLLEKLSKKGFHGYEVMSESEDISPSTASSTLFLFFNAVALTAKCFQTQTCLPCFVPRESFAQSFIPTRREWDQKSHSTSQKLFHLLELEHIHLPRYTGVLEDFCAEKQIANRGDLPLGLRACKSQRKDDP